MNDYPAKLCLELTFGILVVVYGLVEVVGDDMPCQRVGRRYKYDDGTDGGMMTVAWLGGFVWPWWQSLSCSFPGQSSSTIMLVSVSV